VTTNTVRAQDEHDLLLNQTTLANLGFHIGF
jgi:hypothetical protein